MAKRNNLPEKVQAPGQTLQKSTGHKISQYQRMYLCQITKTSYPTRSNLVKNAVDAKYSQNPKSKCSICNVCLCCNEKKNGNAEVGWLTKIGYFNCLAVLVGTIYILQSQKTYVSRVGCNKELSSLSCRTYRTKTLFCTLCTFSINAFTEELVF